MHTDEMLETSQTHIPLVKLSAQTCHLNNQTRFLRICSSKLTMLVTLGHTEKRASTLYMSAVCMEVLQTGQNSTQSA